MSGPLDDSLICSTAAELAKYAGWDDAAATLAHNRVLHGVELTVTGSRCGVHRTLRVLFDDAEIAFARTPVMMVVSRVVAALKREEPDA